MVSNLISDGGQKKIIIENNNGVRVHHEGNKSKQRAMGRESTVEKSIGARVHYEKKSYGVRVHHEE